MPVIGQQVGAGKFSITVNVPNIPLFLPDQARAELNGLTLNTMRLALQEAAGRISDEAPVDTGGLAASFGSNPATQVGGIELLGTDVNASLLQGRVFSSLPHAIVMDQGRRAGAPISRAGIDAIGLWAQRKLGLSADEADNAKFAIANAIVARGIAPTHYFRTGVAQAQPTIERLFAILGEQMAQALTTEGGA